MLNKFEDLFDADIPTYKLELTEQEEREIAHHRASAEADERAQALERRMDSDNLPPSLLHCDVCSEIIHPGSTVRVDINCWMAGVVPSPDDPYARRVLDAIKSPQVRPLLRCSACVQAGKYRSAPSFTPPTTGRRRR